jgi:phosphate transport system protein
MAVYTHLDTELNQLKQDILEMFNMVIHQLDKAKESLIIFDKDLAREVIIGEKRVNSFELKIDRDCENIFALYQPVAVDLRFVLATLKINSNLERIGDIAEGIARFVIDIKLNPEPQLLEVTRLLEMFDTATSMLSDVKESFENEDTSLARSVFKKDEILDEINIQAALKVEDFIRSHNDRINQSLLVLSMIRKLERVGDQSKNIAEEIIFYIEAKVLKHKTKAAKEKK